MSVFSGPEMANNGLVFAYDMNNTKKSWKGRPITNQFALPTPNVSNDVTFPLNGTGTFKRIYSGTYDGYTISSDDIVYRYDLGVAGCHYHGNQTTITAGQKATFSFDYYVSPDAANYPTLNYLANFEGAVSAAATDPTPTIKGVWKRASFTATAAATGAFNMLLYPGACSSSYLASSGFILYKNPQIEFDAPGNVSSPFVSTTRTNAQALLDFTNINTITATSLTYASDNTFSFNGTSDYISVPGITDSMLNSGSWTLSSFVKFVSVNKGTDNAIAGHGSVAVNNGLHLGERSAFAYFGLYGNDLGGTKPLVANTWYEITYIFDYVTKLKTIYVNGVYDTSGGTIGYSGTGSNFQIGQYPWSTNYKLYGSAAIVRFYNVALSATEVQQGFNALRGRYGV